MAIYIANWLVKARHYWVFRLTWRQKWGCAFVIIGPLVLLYIWPTIQGLLFSATAEPFISKNVGLYVMIFYVVVSITNKLLWLWDKRWWALSYMAVISGSLLIVFSVIAYVGSYNSMGSTSLPDVIGALLLTAMLLADFSEGRLC
jgi:hypothetical protein